MASVNSIISQTDYNSIRNKVIGILGTGSGNSGYGQTIKSSSVADGTKVTINEWANLRYDIINAYTHQNGTSPTTAQVNDGDTIRYTSNFTPDTGTLDVPERQYDVWADNLITNKFNIGSGQYATSTPSSPSTRTFTWSSSASCTISYYWSDANSARYFFNSGGQIRVVSSFARRSGVNTAQNIAWESLLSTAGTLSFGGNYPSAGTTPNDGQNWYRNTNTLQQYWSFASSSPYGSNNYRLYNRCTDVVSNSSGTGKSGEILVQFNDGYVDPGNYYLDNPNTSDVVDGTLTVQVTLFYATGIMVPSGTPNFAVTLPTIAIGGISGS